MSKEKKDFLLPCPFCNSDKACVYKWNMSLFWSVSCMNDDCSMNHVLDNLFETKEAALDFWNCRYGVKYDSNLHERENKLEK